MDEDAAVLEHPARPAIGENDMPAGAQEQHCLRRVGEKKRQPVMLDLLLRDESAEFEPPLHEMPDPVGIVVARPFEKLVEALVHVRLDEFRQLTRIGIAELLLFGRAADRRAGASPHELADAGKRRRGLRRERLETLPGVGKALPDMEMRPPADTAQPLDKQPRIVEQDIVGAGMDQRFGQARKLAENRRGQRMARIGALQIVDRQHGQQFDIGGEAAGADVLDIGTARHCEIDPGRERDETGGQRHTFVAQRDESGQRDAGAGRIAHHHQFRRRDAARQQRLAGRDHILDGERKGMFGRQPVIDHQHTAARIAGHLVGDDAVHRPPVHREGAAIDIEDRRAVGFRRAAPDGGPRETRRLGKRNGLDSVFHRPPGWRGPAIPFTGILSSLVMRTEQANRPYPL